MTDLILKYDLSFEKIMSDIVIFGKWNIANIYISNMSLKNYIFDDKQSCSIVERLRCNLMFHGRNTGKKMMAMRIVQHTFDMIHQQTGENPVQVLVDAIINSGPREEPIRIDHAGCRDAAFKSIKPITECLADELINASKSSLRSFACRQKNQFERVMRHND